MREHVPGIRCIEAKLAGEVFAPHRHDDYTVSLTVSGVQAFDYRGETRFSQPGQAVVLYPDEMHDGRAGNEDGFAFRTLYIPPALLSDALDGSPLPFIAGGVSSDKRLHDAAVAMFLSRDADNSALREEDALFDMAVALKSIGSPEPTTHTPDAEAVQKAKHYIDAHVDQDMSLEDIEAAAGQNRFALSRDFRALLGTSPYRYLTMRRVDVARHLIESGASIAETAAEIGFADQSHLTRHFKKTYGFTPARWRKIVQYG